jgi:acetyltransferase
MSEVAKTALERAGAIVIENSDELFPVAETLSSLPPIRNNAVAILADGGGHATIAADLLTDLGVTIPVLGPKTQAQLQKLLPFGASVPNPVDVAGGTDADPAVFAECARIILKDPAVGGLLIAGLFGGYGIRFAESLAFIEEDAAHRMGKLVKKRGKPIVLHSLFSSAKPHSLDLLRYYGIPVYDSLDIACRCICSLAQYGDYLARYHAKASFEFKWGEKATAVGREAIQRARSEKRLSLLEDEARDLLHSHGVTVFQNRLAKTADEAVQRAAQIDGEVAMKIVSPDILHKSDAGGVRLKLGSEADVRRAFDEIMRNAQVFDPQADVRGVIVSPMADPGFEVIIGTKIDDQFGPVIMFGLGGIWVEVLKDVSFRVLPIAHRSARQMIDEIRSAPILNGVRGNPPADKKALQKLLVKCSEIIEAYPEIEEMDLNPVIVHEAGLTIADARILLAGKGNSAA